MTRAVIALSLATAILQLFQGHTPATLAALTSAGLVMLATISTPTPPTPTPKTP